MCHNLFAILFSSRKLVLPQMTVYKSWQPWYNISNVKDGAEPHDKSNQLSGILSKGIENH